MTTRERFPRGCRVRATAHFRSQFDPRSVRSHTATVVGYTLSEGGVRVRRDGHKTAESYHESYWERIPPEETTHA